KIYGMSKPEQVHAECHLGHNDIFGNCNRANNWKDEGGFRSHSVKLQSSGEPDHRDAWSHVPMDRSNEGCGKSGDCGYAGKTFERCLQISFSGNTKGTSGQWSHSHEP